MLTCSEATYRLDVLARLKEGFLSYLEKASTGAKTPAEAKDALERAKQLKTELEAGIIELSRELVVEITVRHALNPYAEGLKEAGLRADHPECAEQKEMTFNLDTVIEKNCARYTEQDLGEWVADIQGKRHLLAEAVSTPEEMKKIEKRMLAGMVPVVMPGREIQILTWQKALKNLKSILVQNGTNKTMTDPFIYTQEYSKKMTVNADGFFISVPERPYLVWTKPTKKVDPITTNKTLEQQQELYRTMVSTHADKIYDVVDLLPLEYTAMQSVHTAGIKRLASEYTADSPNQTITPLDDYNQSYCRFLSAGLFSDGDVPGAGFNPDSSQLSFNRGGVDADSESGFRPAARS